ncbi:MAG: tol-pal system protein YbgF [Candidatus Latescibacteria bacterium]|nr:tol-pal system protein YbgF [Candidatus Latescibacterota bacterium]
MNRAGQIRQKMTRRTLNVCSSSSFIVLLALGITVGCATRSEVRGFKEDTLQIKGRIDRLQDAAAKSAEVDSLRTSVAVLQSLLREQTDFLWSLKADLNARISNLDDRLQIVEVKITESGRQVSTLSQKVEGVKSRLTPMLVDSTSRQFVDPELLYNTASADYQRGNYDLALSVFSQFVQRFPDSELADNAQFWIGECYYAQKQYTQATEAYNTVLTKYPKGNKVAAALLKLGLAQVALQNVDAARASLKRVIDEFPQSDEAKLARMRLDTLPGSLRKSGK